MLPQPSPTSQAPQIPLSPEIIPAMDENLPVIGKNLAVDEELCKKVAKFIYTNFWYPQLLMQMTLWPLWKKIDEAWRGKMSISDMDLDIDYDKEYPKKSDNLKAGARASSGVFYKQVSTLTKMGISISWEDGVPARFMKPEGHYENPLYNPTQQQVDAANEELRHQAEQVHLKIKDRECRSDYNKYSHAWAMFDFSRKFETIYKQYVLSNDPMQAQQQFAQITQIEQAQPEIGGDQFGRTILKFPKIVPKELLTRFQPLNVEDVLVDLLVPCDPVERQPCPIVKRHITKYDLYENIYDEQNNPFGWLNTETAIQENGHQYALSQIDETALRDKLEQRYGLTDTNGVHGSKQTIKQLWTAYAMLPYDEATGQFDEGEGISCPSCKNDNAGLKVVTSTDPAPNTAPGTVSDGATLGAAKSPGNGSPDCPTCKGSGAVRVTPQRYVCEFFGNLQGQTTCLRIQKNPTADNLVPLGFAALVTEDRASSIPVSPFEIAWNSYRQLVTANNQFLESKNLTINRPWLVQADSPAFNKDINKSNSNIPFESSPNEVTALPRDSYDNTITLMPFMQRNEDEIKQIFGGTDQVLGLIAQGRRSALELGNAINSAQTPITVDVDNYNRQMIGKYANFVLLNLNTWGDRDWIRERTGKESFGKMKLFTAVADEFIKKLALTQNYRYILELSGKIPGVNSGAVLCRLLNLMGLQDVDEIYSDGGFKKNRQDAMNIVSQILGDGKPVPPDPSDPHELYIEVFTQALKDPYWRKENPENLQLMLQRIQLQQMLLLQQQLAQIQQQAGQNHSMAMQADAQDAQAAQPKHTPTGRGEVAQQTLN